MKRIAGILCASVMAFSGGLATANPMLGLKPGKVDLKSVSAMTFGPDGVLFIGDAAAAKVVAVDPKDLARGPLTVPQIEGIDQQLAKLLNVAAKDVEVLDLAVNPMNGRVFVAAAAKGKAPQIFKIQGAHPVALNLNEINFSEVTLPNAAEDKVVNVGGRDRNLRPSAITDLKWIDGRLLISGLANDKAASNVWQLNFPFDEVDNGTVVEFFHAAHGRTEDYAPIRTFIPFVIDGKPNLLAGFVCTPLVRIPVEELKAGGERSKVVGTTVAELGNRNQPLDLIAYKKDGADYLLLSNSARGVMKISTDGLADNAGLTEPVRNGGIAGQKFETVQTLEGTLQMDKLNDAQAAVLIRKSPERVDFQIIELP